ncbi:acyl carrier protein [Aeromicrobium sp. CTD01-1L150]|uniref:acyl carrier protein n=1 Tax=Aeromicrobium sp. CTD01-1L150 TaxID=3341830 RepID=UPI0035BEE358
MPTHAEVRDDLTDILVAVVACDRADVVDEARLEALGVDSLALVEVADELGRRHDRYLVDDVVNHLVTVDDAVRAILEHDGSAGPRRVATSLHHPAPPVVDDEKSHRTSAMSKIAGFFIVLGAIIGVVLGLGGAALVAATGIGGVELPPIAAPSSEPTASASPSPSPEPTEEPEEEEEEDEEPTFEVGSNQVAPGQRFTLSGSFPELDDGEVLQVQVREDDGDWEDFPVTAITSSGGDYQTHVYTSRTGEREFRMLHRSSDTATDSEKVQIG